MPVTPLSPLHGQLDRNYGKLPLAFFWLDSRLAFAYKQSTGRLLYGSARQRGPNKDYFTPPNRRSRWM